MFWLVFALAVLGWVVARQTSAHLLAGELGGLRNERSAREADRATLERRIREASSRARLIPRAERLGLRLPADTQIVILQVPSPEIP